jgi:hypothetical protein
VLPHDLTVQNCIGPAQQRAWLSPVATPEARERPWSDSFFPMAASTRQSTPSARAAAR